MVRIFVVACDSVPGGVLVHLWANCLAKTLQRYSLGSIFVARTTHAPTEEVCSTLTAAMGVERYTLVFKRGKEFVPHLLATVKQRIAVDTAIILTDKETAREFVVQYIAANFHGEWDGKFRPSTEGDGEVYMLRIPSQAVEDVIFRLPANVRE